MLAPRFDIPYLSAALPLGRDGRPQARVLRCRLELPAGPGPHPVLILCHGHTSFMDWGFYPGLSQRCSAAGIACLRFNFSGSGIGPDLRSPVDTETFARNSYLHELDDLDTLWAELQQRADPRLDLDRAALFGHSRGGGMALVHAAERGHYRLVCTWAPLCAILRFSPQRLAEWQHRGSLGVMHWTLGRRLPQDYAVVEASRAAGDRLDIPRAAGALNCPWLCVAGSGDRSIPIQEIEALCAQHPTTELLRLEGADHVFGAEHPQPEPWPQALQEAAVHSLQRLREALGVSD